MKIICAPDSFKESISARTAAEAMARGIRRAKPDAAIDICPVADGGEGTLDVLMTAMRGEIRHAQLIGPLGNLIEAHWGLAEDGLTAVIEMAAASGLALVPRNQRDPTKTTTYGTGQLVKRAIEAGAREIIIGVGGSATVDGGTGAAQALGAIFFDRYDMPIASPMIGGRLMDIARLNRAPQLGRIKLRIACDVTNPLLGPRGAARVFAPQKGATVEQVEALEVGLAHLAQVAGGDPDAPGAGAAGGLSYGLATLCNAALDRGIDLVLEEIRFAERCAGADLVITGEGQLDSQTLEGKAVIGVARAAGALNIPTIAIVGAFGEGAHHCLGDPTRGLLQDAISLTDRFGGARALADPAACVEEATANLITRMSDSKQVSQ